jgi:hypothetical protein
VDLWQALRLPLLAVALSAAEEQLEEQLSGDSTKHHPMPLVPMPSPSKHVGCSSNQMIGVDSFGAHILFYVVVSKLQMNSHIDHPDQICTEAAMIQKSPSSTTLPHAQLHGKVNR